MIEVSLEYSKIDTIRFFITNEKKLNWIGTFDSKEYNRFFVIIDKNVFNIWGQKIYEQLNKHNKEIFTYQVEPVEFSKSIGFYPTMISYLEKYMCNRYDLIIAVGGGIILDLVSFLASTYMRGLPFYAFPTTIIGQVDATTAGKTCLNSENGKNVLGTFYYPLVVYNNINFLNTNSPYYSRQGFSEVFKYGLLASKQLLKKLGSYHETKSDEDLMDMIELTIKARSVIRKKDPLASNLGHTFGHAIEKLSNYKILHGDAITVGTVLALNFAKKVNFIKEETVNEIIAMIKNLHLNIYLDKDLNIDMLIHHMMHDKKSSVDKLNLVLITDIEQPYEQDNNLFYSTSPVILKEFLKEFLKNYKYRISNCANFIKENKLYYEGQK
jgi:3-dehydroquinate synthetase